MLETRVLEARPGPVPIRPLGAVAIKAHPADGARVTALEAEEAVVTAPSLPENEARAVGTGRAVPVGRVGAGAAPRRTQAPAAWGVRGGAAAATGPGNGRVALIRAPYEVAAVAAPLLTKAKTAPHLLLGPRAVPPPPGRAPAPGP